MNLHGVFAVHYDGCAYGLQLPGHEPGVFCKKRSTIITNVVALKKLEKFCPCNHAHEHAFGSRKVNNKSIKLAAAAGKYSEALVQTVSKLVVGAFSHGHAWLSVSV